MRLNHLSLTNFRLFSRLDMDLPSQILLLEGNNAQGKTSLLEAIFFLATFTSLHASHDRQLINFLASQESLAVARLTASFATQERESRLEIRLIQELNGNGGSRLRKEVLLNGAKISPNQAVGAFKAVMFLPEMTRIIEGGPEERRRYLNLAIAQSNRNYTQTLADYNQTVSQRNALLKQLFERGGDEKQLDFWDQVLATKGALLMQARIQAIEEIGEIAIRIHSALTDSKEVLRLYYQPAYDPVVQPQNQFSLPMQTKVERGQFTLEQLQTGFTARLAQLHREEILRGVTTIGPHRDEMRIHCNGIDLTDFGSRGQIRTALLSLKLAEIEWLKQKTGEMPVLLLDETLAELDEARRESLLTYLTSAEQAVLTTTDMNLFPTNFSGKCERWWVDQGNIHKKDS
ncbi:MAG: DNA replication and repair protein RecF [Anaerolineaceae bacterium]|jgi:DNA replication and repair protein RecF|nr:DNA replication and repair protein RecF [Anaerolineaceae bacterium]